MQTNIDLTGQNNGGATMLAFNGNALKGHQDGYGVWQSPTRFVPAKAKYLTGNETEAQKGKPTRSGAKK